MLTDVGCYADTWHYISRIDNYISVLMEVNIWTRFDLKRERLFYFEGISV
jgi:hypothetical protein